MAAALFGGISASAQPPVAPPAPPVPAATPQMAVASPPAPIATPVTTAPISAPAPAVAAPEVDLLDMGAWGTDNSGSMAVAEPSTIDMLAPTPTVEAVVVPPPADVPAPPESTGPPTDPFADAGLLDGLSDSAPLSSFGSSDMVSSKFEYAGVAVAPLTITTPQFGERWGQCPSTHPVNVPSSTIASTLSKFMDLCASAGMHKVEEIAATNEGIAACMAGGGSAIALVHGKISPLPGGQQSRVDITVKSTDAQLGGTLAMYLQNMLR